MVANADGYDARALLGPLELISASWSPTSDSMAVITAPIGGEATLSIVSTRSGESPRSPCRSSPRSASSGARRMEMS